MPRAPGVELIFIDGIGKLAQRLIGEPLPPQTQQIVDDGLPAVYPLAAVWHGLSPALPT